jgi:hypothetical protein
LPGYEAALARLPRDRLLASAAKFRGQRAPLPQLTARSNLTGRASLPSLTPHFARERPEWLVILRACCAVAKDSETTGLGFTGSSVRQTLMGSGAPEATWFPGLTLLELRGLVTKLPEKAAQLHSG